MPDFLRAEFIMGLLWRATWQSVALTLIVISVMLIARRKIAPRWRVVLWSLPLLRLALLVVPTSNLSLFNLVEPSGAGPIASSAPMSFPIQSLSTHSSSREFTLPVFDSSLETRRKPTTPSVEGIAAESVMDNSSVSKGASAVTNSGIRVLLWLWIAGCTFSLVRYGMTRIQLARILAQATPIDGVGITGRLRSKCKSIGIRRPIKCLLVDTEVGPASTGLLRPTILIPRSLLSELNENQLIAIIDHELHHIRRLDSAYLLLSRLVCCLHWFNPLAYWLATRVRTEIEFAVDAATVGQVDDQARKSYGDLLIQLARRRSRSLGLAPMADRRSNLKQRIEELLVPVRNTKLRSICCLAIILLLSVSGLSEVASTQEKKIPSISKSSQDETAAEKEGKSGASSKNEFELLVVDNDGQAIPEAQVEVRGRPKVFPDWIVEGEFIKQGPYGTFVKPSKDGRVRLLPPPNSSWIFSIKADGYGPYWAEWDHAEMPTRFTAELDPGRIVGGVVVDQEGNPVIDAGVRPSVEFKKRPGDTSQLGVGTNIKTDEQGRWSYANLPRAMSSFSLEITHPQFKPQVAKLSAETFELQPGQSATQTTTMEKGLLVTGRIVDSAGKPVQGALIRTKLFNDIRSTQSNDDGAYELSGCQDGVARIVVSAPGQAVDMKQVHITEKMDAVDFTMQPGGHVRIRVVDEHGEPVPKARIFFQRWREGMYDYFEFDHVDQYADGNGVWEWNEAPVDEFKADICRPDGMALGEQPLHARAEDYVFTCPPKLVVVGRVIDAETKLPIEKFQVVPGVRSDPQHMNWVPHQIFEAQDGVFETSETNDYFAHLFKIQARGYLPAESRDIKSNEGRVEVTFELKRGADIDMRVMTPEGLPAEGAKVALGIPGAQIHVKNGDIDDGQTYAQRAEVNSVGRFRFPGQSTAYQLIITHQSGFAYFKSVQAERSDLVRLTPWASAEGTFRVAKKPVGGVKLHVGSGEVHSYGDDVPNIFTSCETVTNQDGSFRFNRVFPGSGGVARSILRIVDEGAKEVTSSTTLPAEFISKQTTRVDFGLTGCPVVGKLIKPDAFHERVLWSFANIDVEPQFGPAPGPPPIPEELKNEPAKIQNWYNTWKETDAGKAWLVAIEEANRERQASPRYNATCDTHGRFQIDDMPAGTYKLSVRFYESPRVGQLHDYVFTVPENRATNGETVDLGTLQLESSLRD